jgi:hypothetical protein
LETCYQESMAVAAAMALAGWLYAWVGTNRYEYTGSGYPIGW